MRSPLLRQTVPQERKTDFNSPSWNPVQVSGQAIAWPMKSVTVLSSIQESAKTKPTPFIGAVWVRGQ
jgi:hypothetical protein